MLEMLVIVLVLVLAVAIVAGGLVIARNANVAATPSPPPSSGGARRNGGGGVREAETVVNSSGLTTTPPRDIVITRNGFSLVAAKRLAGGIYSLKWNGHTIIPELEGNGGSLQVALAFDVPIGESPEIENPTEAGTHRDNYGKTSSKWIDAAFSATEVYTKSQLAYYYPPGEAVASSPKKTIARGSSLLSDVFMTKRVTAGWKFPNVINFAVSLKWSKPHWFCQIQLLAVYLARDFLKVYLCKNGVAVPHSTGDPTNIVKISPPQKSFPIIVAKSDAVAVGLYAHTISNGGRFPLGQQPWYSGDLQQKGHKDYGRGLQEVNLSAFTAVCHLGDPTNPRTRIATSFSYGICLVFGTVKEVAQTIKKLGG